MQSKWSTSSFKTLVGLHDNRKTLYVVPKLFKSITQGYKYRLLLLTFFDKKTQFFQSAQRHQKIVCCSETVIFFFYIMCFFQKKPDVLPWNLSHYLQFFVAPVLFRYGKNFAGRLVIKAHFLGERHSSVLKRSLEKSMIPLVEFF